MNNKRIVGVSSPGEGLAIKKEGKAAHVGNRAFNGVHSGQPAGKHKVESSRFGGQGNVCGNTAAPRHTGIYINVNDVVCGISRPRWFCNDSKQAYK